MKVLYPVFRAWWQILVRWLLCVLATQGAAHFVWLCYCQDNTVTRVERMAKKYTRNEAVQKKFWHEQPLERPICRRKDNIKPCLWRDSCEQEFSGWRSCRIICFVVIGVGLAQWHEEAHSGECVGSQSRCCRRTPGTLSVCMEQRDSKRMHVWGVPYLKFVNTLMSLLNANKLTDTLH